MTFSLGDNLMVVMIIVLFISTAGEPDLWDAATARVMPVEMRSCEE